MTRECVHASISVFPLVKGKILIYCDKVLILYNQSCTITTKPLYFINRTILFQAITSPYYCFWTSVYALYEQNVKELWGCLASMPKQRCLPKYLVQDEILSVRPFIIDCLYLIRNWRCGFEESTFLNLREFTESLRISGRAATWLDFKYYTLGSAVKASK